MNEPERIYHLTHMPYLGLGDVDSISDGDITVWNADKKLDDIVHDTSIRNHVRALLRMNCSPGRDPSKPIPLSGIGIVGIGNVDFRQFTEDEHARIVDFQVMLFLAGLLHNVNIGHEPNAGHWIYTTENFSMVEQNFVPDSPWISERSGVIVEVTSAGYDINTTKWWRPSEVLHPSPFRIDADMFRQLQWLRDNDSDLFRRMMRAGKQFMEGYYNAPHVTINSRVYAQLVAFEILLKLPEDQQKKAFRESIGRLLDLPDDPVETFQSERRVGTSETETGTAKVMWADHFYTLRNHQIHGKNVTPAEYMFKGEQSHLQAAPIVFVATVIALIEKCRADCGLGLGFSITAMLKWTSWENDEIDPPRTIHGFKLVPDWVRVFRESGGCGDA